MQPDSGERLPSSRSFLDEGPEGASAVPSGNPERDKRSCETDMRMLLMLGVETNILPHLAVWSILFLPPPPPQAKIRVRNGVLSRNRRFRLGSARPKHE